MIAVSIKFWLRVWLIFPFFEFSAVSLSSLNPSVSQPYSISRISNHRGDLINFEIDGIRDLSHLSSQLHAFAECIVVILLEWTTIMVNLLEASSNDIRPFYPLRTSSEQDKKIRNVLTNRRKDLSLEFRALWMTRIGVICRLLFWSVEVLMSVWLRILYHSCLKEAQEGQPLSRNFVRVCSYLLFWFQDFEKMVM